jgi:hypothetical protein
MNPSRPPLLVLPDTSRRDTLIAVVAGICVLAFIFFGIGSFFSASHEAQANTISGTILEKQFTAQPEELITVGGKKGLRSKHIAGEYLLTVEVKGERFEVPVDQTTYFLKKTGDSLTFRRPGSGH